MLFDDQLHVLPADHVIGFLGSRLAKPEKKMSFVDNL